MAIHLHDKYAKDIQTRFVKESLLAGRLSTEYSFVGVKTVKVSTPQTVPMGDYTRSGTNRYGIPTEIQDIVQELTLSQDKSFALTIDKGNNADQSNTKAAGKMLALQISEQAIPTMDKYGFEQLALKAGKIAGNSTALNKTNVCVQVLAGTTHLDDAEVPDEGRTLFVPSATYALLKQSTEFLGNEKLGYKVVTKGQVGEYDGMAVVKVPSGRWPANVNFIIVHKRAATMPVKLNDTKLHEDPPGISGNLLEGRQYYDLFVFGAKCDAVYVEVNTGQNKGTVCAAPVIATEADSPVAVGDFSSTTNGVTFKYTTDGTDPRYSNTAVVGAASAVVDVGTVIKCYCYKDGAYPSGVTTATIPETAE
jgi:hypothetical protein